MKRPALEALVDYMASGFRESGAAFAVVGGLAVGARIGPRFTRDVDFAVAVSSEEEAETILGYFIRYGFVTEAEIHHENTGRLHTMRMQSPPLPDADPDEGQPVADLIFATTGIEQEIVASATPAPVYPGLKLPTARIPHLIAMKTLSESDIRLQDRIDLQNLIAAATDEDLQEVPPLLALIAERGFDRNKNLPAVFTHFLQYRNAFE